jgi:hypothetical protein
LLPVVALAIQLVTNTSSIPSPFTSAATTEIALSPPDEKVQVDANVGVGLLVPSGHKTSP